MDIKRGGKPAFTNCDQGAVFNAAPLLSEQLNMNITLSSRVSKYIL